MLQSESDIPDRCMHCPVVTGLRMELCEYYDEMDGYIAGALEGKPELLAELTSYMRKDTNQGTDSPEELNHRRIKFRKLFAGLIDEQEMHIERTLHAIDELSALCLGSITLAATGTSTAYHVTICQSPQVAVKRQGAFSLEQALVQEQASHHELPPSSDADQSPTDQ